MGMDELINELSKGIKKVEDKVLVYAGHEHEQQVIFKMQMLAYKRFRACGNCLGFNDMFKYLALYLGDLCDYYIDLMELGEVQE